MGLKTIQRVLNVFGNWVADYPHWFLMSVGCLFIGICLLIYLLQHHGI